MSLDMYMGAEDLGLDDNLGGGDLGGAGEGSVATEVAELAVVIEEQSNAIEALVEEVNELDDTVEQLEEVIEGTESLLESGNYNPKAMAILYGRGVTLVNRLGGDLDDNRMGVEALGDAATAVVMCRGGLESFVEKAKEYGRKAVEYIKHVFNVVINFFVSLFNQTEALQRRSTQLKKRIDEGAKIKEEIKLGGWNIFFDYAKNGLNESAKAKHFTATQTAMVGFLELGKNVNGVDLSSFKTHYSALIAGIKTDATAIGKSQAKKNGSNNVIIGQYNGIRIRATYNDMDAKDMSEAASAARSVKITVGKDPDAKKMQSGTAKSKCDKAKLQSVLSEINKDLAGVRNSAVSKKFSTAERDRVIGSLNAIKAGDSDRASDVSKQVNLVRAIYAAGASLSQSVSKCIYQEIKATLDGVAAHVSF